MPKKLHQINWSEGQVDGDNLPGMVSEILNMELDRPGALRTRDSLVSLGQSPTEGFAHARITTNPTGDEDYQNYTWDIYFLAGGPSEENYIQLIGTPNGPGNYVLQAKGYPFDIPNLDPDKSEMVIYGERVFFCAVDSSNTPLGVCIVSFIPRGRRFRDGPSIEGSVFNVPLHEQRYDWTWVVRSIDPIKPDVVSSVARSFQIMGYEDLMEYWGIICGGRDIHDSLFLGMDAVRSSMPVGGCGLVLTAMPEEDGLYGSNAVVEYRVQFKYGDGRFSRLSDPQRINISDVAQQWEDDILDNEHDNGSRMFEPDAYDEFKYGIGVSLMVSKDLDESVDEVRIYKKVIDSDNADLEDSGEYELLQIAKVRDDETDPIEELGMPDVTVNERFSWAQTQQFGDYSFQAFMCDPGPPVYLDIEDDLREIRFSTFNGEERRGHQTVTGGTLYRGSGWCSNSQCMVYIPECYGVSDGTLTIQTIQQGPAGNYQYFHDPFTSFYNLTMLIATYRSNDPGTRLGLGFQAPTYGAQRIANDDWIAIGQHAKLTDRRYLPHDEYTANISTLGNMLCNSEVCVLDFGTGTFGGSYIGPMGYTLEQYGIEQNRPPVPFIMDLGNASLYTDESFTGVSEEDYVTVRPRHIAVSGGRLFCLNGLFDGSDEETRMFYSSYNNFSSFSRYAFIDYGARGDGVGVGMSTHRNKLLLHFSGATYVVDISGGIDASWRELGAISAMGAVSRKSITETPVGVFWYNGVDLVWFNGNRVDPVSHLEKRRRSVRETLSEMIDGEHESVVLAYRKALRQVWCCMGSDVMVFDIDSFAWHKHELDEIEGTIIDISGDASDENLLTSTDTYSFDPTGQVSFNWGLKGIVDIGVPEIEKKAKRIYMDHRPYDSTVERALELIVTGNGVSQTHDILTKVGGGVVRAQASIRGRHIELDLHTTDGGGHWRNEIESVGMSYKPKRVK